MISESHDASSNLRVSKTPNGWLSVPTHEKGQKVGKSSRRNFFKMSGTKQNNYS